MKIIILIVLTLFLVMPDSLWAGGALPERFKRTNRAQQEAALLKQEIGKQKQLQQKRLPLSPNQSNRQ